MSDDVKDDARAKANTGERIADPNDTPPNAPYRFVFAAWLGSVIAGLLDGYWAVNRPGLDPLDDTEAAAVIYLAVALWAPIGLVGGALAGGAWWLLTRWRTPAQLWRMARSRYAIAAAAVAIAVLAVGGYFYVSARHIDWDAVDGRLPGLALLVMASLPLGASVQRWRPLAIAMPLAALLITTMALFGWPSTGDGRDEGLVRLGTESAGARRVLVWTREQLLDGDGDTYPTSLCRLDCDCDDADPAIFPGAAEQAGNGVDEDCDGKDLTLEELARYQSLMARAPESPPQPEEPQPAAEPAPLDVPPEPEPPPPGVNIPRGGKPDIIFITIDTLRADHLGFNGYHRDTSPRLDALAAESVVFDQARATGPQTRFSVPSMLTSKYFTEIARTPGQWPRISPKENLIAERLQDVGYYTAAWHSVSYFAPLYEMNQGFEHYDDSPMKIRHPWQRNATSDVVTRKALGHVDTTAFKEAHADRPYFFWVYYGDPHSGYLFHDGFPKFGRSRKDAYDAEIYFTDHHVGLLLDGLEERGLLDNAVVIITSDHGEGLDEEEDHGHRFHGPVLHDEAMKVPLIFKAPGLEPQRVPTSVSLIDLAPTIADLAGASVDEMRGISLRPWLEGESPEHPPVFFEKQKEDALPQKGMVLWPYKVILVLPYNRLKIYDLEADPRERTDLTKTMDKTKKEELVGLLNYWSSTVLKPVEPKKRP